MDSDAFRKYGKEMVDIVADFWESLDNDQLDSSERRKPLPTVKPGFIWEMVPPNPPEEPEPWSNIFADLEPVVFANNTHWHHPKFFAYYPTACSYAAIIGDILSGGISSIGFTWKSSPAMTELEMVMTDWIAKSLGLPAHFLNSDPGPGAGIIQNTASDATFVALLSARARAIKKLKLEEESLLGKSLPLPFSTVAKAISNLNLKEQVQRRIFSLFGENKRTGAEPTENGACPIENRRISVEEPKPTIFDVHDASVFSRFVGYCSDQAHSSVEKAMMLCGVRMRKLRTTARRDSMVQNFDVVPEVLEAAIKEDRSSGLIPFAFVLTVGTTNTCAVESLTKLGPICARENIWVHVDAAYAGSFLLCEEFRYLCEGIEFADSFNFNAHKAMMVNFDCSPMWFKNASEATSYFNVDPLYLKHEHQAVASDYRHLQIALGRRFRSLKIWFVMRAIGVKRIQEWLQTQVRLAEHFAKLIVADSLFELFVPQHLGLVCFRLKASNEVNEALTAEINEDGRIHLVAARVHGVYFQRFSVCSTKTTEKDVEEAFTVIQEISTRILAKFNAKNKIN